MAATRETPIVVRDAVAADHELAQSLIAPATARGRTSLAMLREGRGHLWVAVTTEQGSERIVGLLLADTQMDADLGEPAGYIQELLVHPAYRRRGVAMHLLDAAERHYFSALGLGAVMLVTTPENEGAIRLYRSRGYGMDQVRLRKRAVEE
ncbi:MAG TPA: N-acetyltransferase [Ktedonobacterales bacterium]|nr:N-acetyltransferase [Ktedonobacterales bacterium]